MAKPIPTLAEELTQEEGRRELPYKDTKGIWTCGVGCNLEAHGLVHAGSPTFSRWSADDIQAALTKDILKASQTVHAHAPWVINLDAIRARVVVHMVFQMGWGDGGAEQRGRVDGARRHDGRRGASAADAGRRQP